MFNYLIPIYILHKVYMVISTYRGVMVKMDPFAVTPSLHVKVF